MPTGVGVLSSVFSLDKAGLVGGEVQLAEQGCPRKSQGDVPFLRVHFHRVHSQEVNVKQYLRVAPPHRLTSQSEEPVRTEQQAATFSPLPWEVEGDRELGKNAYFTDQQEF